MDFLSNRRQRVNVNGSYSDWSNVIKRHSTRECAWSSLSYCIYINDLYLKLSKVLLLFLLMTPSYKYL